jgi:hypothetical protein
MAARTLRVEFLPTDAVDGVRPESPRSEIHDIALGDAVAGVPEVLENPHVDFPGTWVLIGEGVDRSYRYARADRVADTSDTVAD